MTKTEALGKGEITWVAINEEAVIEKEPSDKDEVENVLRYMDLEEKSRGSTPSRDAQIKPLNAPTTKQLARRARRKIKNCQGDIDTTDTVGELKVRNETKAIKIALTFSGGELKCPSCEEGNTLSRQIGRKGVTTTASCKRCPKTIAGGKVRAILEDQLGQQWMKNMLLLQIDGVTAAKIPEQGR